MALGRSDDDPSSRSGGIAGVRSACGLDEQQLRLLVGERLVLDADRHDEELARTEDDLRARQADRQLPMSTKKRSSVSSWWCQTNSPLTLTTMMSCPLNRATVRGDQCSSKDASFCSRLTTPVDRDGTRRGSDGRLRDGSSRPYPEPAMALFHLATITPTKDELIAR